MSSSASPSICAFAITDARSPRGFRRRSAAIGRKYNLVLGTFGHAGDGNLHPTILADKKNLDEMARVHKAVAEIFDAALSFGGTLSGEHGIGIAKMKFLGNEIGESGLDLMRTIKAALDPEYLLNPGKLVPEREPANVH